MRCTQVLSKPKWAEMVLTDFGEDRLLASALKDMTCFLLRNPLPGSVLHSKVLWKWYNLLMIQFRLVDQWHRILMNKGLCLSVQLQLASMFHVQSTRLIQCMRAFLHFLKRLIRMHPCLMKGKLTYVFKALVSSCSHHKNEENSCCGGTWPTAKSRGGNCLHPNFVA